MVLRSRMPDRMAKHSPITYREKTTRRRSFSFSMVRAPMTAGTVQPKPMSMGINALPDSPKRRSNRSIMKAARAM